MNDLFGEVKTHYFALSCKPEAEHQCRDDFFAAVIPCRAVEIFFENSEQVYLSTIAAGDAQRAKADAHDYNHEQETNHDNKFLFLHIEYANRARSGEAE